MTDFTNALTKYGLLKSDLDYHLIRVAMVIVFLSFGYQKWFEYEAQVLMPFIGNGPLISWLHPVFGTRGASWFLGVTEWLFCLLLFLGFWNKPARILGALGSICDALDGSLYQQQPVHLLAVSSLRPVWGCAVLGSVGMDYLRAFVCWVLG
jgi:uncharacterized membrane protein YkgB